jgi:hypothetical protein
MMSPRSVDLARSFERHLRAENKSDRTAETYLEAVNQVAQFLEPHGVKLVVRVVGKGGRERALPFGRRTGLALDLPSGSTQQTTDPGGLACALQAWRAV